MTFALIQEKGATLFWWHIPPGRKGRWVADPQKANQYKSEWGAHIAWTAVSSHHRGVRCVPHPENKTGVFDE